MGEKKWLSPERLDIVIAVLIALVSLTASLAAWRTNVDRIRVEAWRDLLFHPA